MRALALSVVPLLGLAHGDVPDIQVPRNASWVQRATSVFTKKHEEFEDYIIEEKIECYGDTFRIEVFGGGSGRLILTGNGGSYAGSKNGNVLKGNELDELIKAYPPRFLLDIIERSRPKAQFVKEQLCGGTMCDLYRAGDKTGKVSFWVSQETRLVKHLVSNGTSGQVVVVAFEWLDASLSKPPETRIGGANKAPQGKREDAGR